MKHFTLTDRIKEALIHYDYCIVKTSGYTSDNQIVVPETTIGVVFRDLTIRFGAERVTKSKGKVKIT